MTISQDSPGSVTEPSPETLAMLHCLRDAVADALDRKRRLGHYWVQWTPDGPTFMGPDAPVLARGSHPEE